MEKKERRKAGNCSDEWQAVGGPCAQILAFFRVSNACRINPLRPPKDPATAHRSKWCLSSAILRNSENPFCRGGGGGIREFDKSSGRIEVGGIVFES
ncbi:unnamed protein product [Sphagnum jensenii]|uniref:Uncharacterized protein n=1 Tax=Sphagnum jensenii TaxID=128206 RepID=A0ABP1C216_9BRYO